jgi:cytochrome c-type biogenesis protein CcmH
MRRRLAASLAALAVLLAAPATADACNGWSELGMQQQLMCPVCHQRLDQSESNVADQIRHVVHQKCVAGWSQGRVKSWLVANFGEGILAAPPKRGFNLLAWVVPGAVLLTGAGVAAGLVLAWTRRRAAARPAPPPAALDPALEARIDADLRRLE